MIKTTQNITKIKQRIQANREKRVRVWLNCGRNKIVKYSGVLTGVYPEIFTVLPDDKTFLGKTSYSYAEVLCGEVKIISESEWEAKRKQA